MKPRAHVNRLRCLYTGGDLDPDAIDDALKPSLEHVIPLALGGVGAFSVDCVSVTANNKAGNQIDDRLGATLPFIMLRQKYRLQGHRRNVPTVHLEGEFTDLGRDAWLDIEPDGSLTWGIPNREEKRGKVISVSGTAEQVSARVLAILNQVGPKGLNVLTPWGQIKDAEDLEIAMALADVESGREFKATIKIELDDYSRVLGRFAAKVALCAGFLVLGREWAFGPAGIKLRSALFCDREHLPKIAGTCSARLKESLRNAIGIRPHRHVIAVLAIGKKTMACISLFGGALGEWMIELGGDHHRRFYSPRLEPLPIDCVFTIDLDATGGARTYATKSFASIANGLDPVLASIETGIDLINPPFKPLR